jgi:hypothetical protein
VTKVNRAAASCGCETIPPSQCRASSHHTTHHYHHHSCCEDQCALPVHPRGSCEQKASCTGQCGIQRERGGGQHAAAPPSALVGNHCHTKRAVLSHLSYLPSPSSLPGARRQSTHTRTQVHHGGGGKQGRWRRPILPINQRSVEQHCERQVATRSGHLTSRVEHDRHDGASRHRAG